MGAEATLPETLKKLGLEMPSAPEPKGLYKPLVIVGNLAYTSGHLPVIPAGNLVTGRVGADLDSKAGHAAAVLAGLGILATLRKELGSLDRVCRVVKLLGLVNCTPEFTEQPAVLNGCSQLFAEVFGAEAGVGARSAVGVSALPANVPVEIEAVFEITP
jgi:enamine deaminase RidA (YjgF/YER057c/UK114 family)